MESWDEMTRSLPSDETLARKEKTGELREFDRKLDLLGEQIKKLKQEMKEQDKEIDKMFEDLDITKEETNVRKK